MSFRRFDFWLLRHNCSRPFQTNISWGIRYAIRHRYILHWQLLDLAIKSIELLTQLGFQWIDRTIGFQLFAHVGFHGLFE